MQFCRRILPYNSSMLEFWTRPWSSFTSIFVQVAKGVHERHMLYHRLFIASFPRLKHLETSKHRFMYGNKDTPKTAGRDGVIGNTKSQTVMLNWTLTQVDASHSSSISIFLISPQLAARSGDWRTWCNPSQMAWSASVCRHSGTNTSAKCYGCKYMIGLGCCGSLKRMTTHN